MSSRRGQPGGSRVAIAGASRKQPFSPQQQPLAPPFGAKHRFALYVGLALYVGTAERHAVGPAATQVADAPQPMGARGVLLAEGHQQLAVHQA